jgi:AcrR family transcriptional regulator
MSEPISTKGRILDAAEKLFGMNGFEATSLRDITAEAGVNLAAVNYHFHSKDSLIDATIERRIEPVNRKRLELLEALGPGPTLEGILAAFLEPVMMSDFRPVVPLIGRVMSNPEMFQDRVFRNHLMHISQRFQEALGRALPELTKAEIVWRYTFTVGIMHHILCWSDILPVASGGICTMDDRAALLERVVSFAAAGFRSASKV